MFHCPLRTIWRRLSRCAQQVSQKRCGEPCGPQSTTWLLVSRQVSHATCRSTVLGRTARFRLGPMQPDEPKRDGSCMYVLDGSGNIYLTFDLTKRDRALALHQKCLIYYRRKDWDKAEQLANEAWSLGKLKRTKNRLNKIKNARAREATK